MLQIILLIYAIIAMLTAYLEKSESEIINVPISLLNTMDIFQKAIDRIVFGVKNFHNIIIII